MKSRNKRFRFLTVRLIRVMAIAFIGIVTIGCGNNDNNKNEIRIATFKADATPPLGTPLSGESAKRIQDSLMTKGIVLMLSDQLPIVLCSVDWIGIGNGGHDDWRQALADAAGTSPDTYLKFSPNTSQRIY